MKIALVNDYIKEYGGAERVLEALCEVFPDSPIYTAFVDKNGNAYEHFKQKKIIPSWAQNVPFFASKLHSPLRFLAPLVWGSFKEEFKKYDVIISSASWYITKGFGFRNQKSSIRQAQYKNQKLPVEVCYCHTPPRWLYGYTTSVNFQKYPLVRVYAAIVGHFMRLYDFRQAQKVNYFIANSNEVRGRIEKFYRRDSAVIYPPVGLASSKLASSVQLKNPKLNASPLDARRSYYLIVSRLVGAKGLELAVDAAKKMGIKLKIAGAQVGYYSEYKKYPNGNDNIQFLGYVSDAELVGFYRGAKAFLALARDEDFGITPVEAMSVGTPVIAFNGGGYKETVLDKKTGLLFGDYSVTGLIKAIKQFNSLTIDPKECISQAQKFSKERFKKEILEFIKNVK